MEGLPEESAILEVNANTTSPDVKVKCKQCDRFFTSERSLRCHIKVHNDKLLECYFCDKMFNRTDTLFFHALDHISKGTLPCRAEGCDQLVETMLEGENHANTAHHVNGTVSIKCKDCSEVSVSFRKMLFHHTFKHGELKEYAEEMIIKQKDFLRMKKNQSRKERKTSVGAKEESKQFDVQDALEIEVKEEIYEADEDDGILKQLQMAMSVSSASNSEMIAKLSDVIAELFPLNDNEKYQCTHCLMSFTDAILWMTHIGYHEIDDPFKCSGCGRKFENRQAFALHLNYFAHTIGFGGGVGCSF